MKYVYLMCLPLLMGCSSSAGETSNNNEEQKEIGEHDYSEIQDKKISWDDVFKQEPYTYYCYIYSEKCSHCNEIKNVVIDYALNHSNFYFVEFNKDVIPVMNDVSMTIGAKDVSEAGILGTPTLFYLINYTLIENIAGSQKVLDELRKQ